MNTITYHSTNAPADKAWLAYVILPNGDMWQVRFEGATEADAKAKAIACYERELTKWSKQDISEAVEQPKEATTPHAWGETKHHLAGLVWVVNKELKDKRRVAPAELDGYLSRGYVRGGPRTSL